MLCEVEHHLARPWGEKRLALNRGHGRILGHITQRVVTRLAVVLDELGRGASDGARETIRLEDQLGRCRHLDP